MKNKIYLLILVCVNSTYAYSMSINNLMLINSNADKGKSGIYTISNTDDITYFLKISTFKIEVKNNKIIKIPYTRDNLNSWDIVPKPSKIVMKAGIDKQIMIEEICGNSCDYSKDRVYQLNIEPVSYEVSGERKNKVNMLFGYSPYYIVPAKKSHVEYSIKYNGFDILVNNTGNTLLKIVIDQCKDKSSEELKIIEENNEKRCNISYVVIAGRKKKLKLPEEMRQSQLDVVVLNHDESYRDEKTLRSN